MSMNNLHSDHDLYQAVLFFSRAQNFQLMLGRNKRNTEEVFSHLLHSRIPHLGAGQESLSPGHFLSVLLGLGEQWCFNYRQGAGGTAELCVASTESLGFASTGSPEPPLLFLTVG